MASDPRTQTARPLRTALKLMAAALFLFVTGGPAVIAEGGDDAFGRFVKVPVPRSFQSGPVVKRQRSIYSSQGSSYFSPRTAARERFRFRAPVDAPAAASSEPTFFINVMGDSLGQILAQGLQDGLSDRPEILVRRKARESSGLVRDDFYDWLKAARDAAAGPERLDFAVMMVGANDRQTIKDAAGAYEPRSDKWREIYVRRVEDIATAFRDKKIPLVWVGLPVMRNDRQSADAVYLNDIFREAAVRTGAVYVDTWEAFVDDKGQYSPYGPDLTGQVGKLRAGDGIHFTKTGARKLAHFVEGDIRRALGDATPAVDLAAIPQAPPSAVSAVPAAVTPVMDGDGLVDAQAVISAQIKREVLSGAARSDLQAALPLPELPQALHLPVRPAAGAVVPLTGPALSPGGLLAARGRGLSAALGGEGQQVIERALAEGRPIESKQGRADDFTWPRR